jgi:hypothetical protein
LTSGNRIVLLILFNAHYKRTITVQIENKSYFVNRFIYEKDDQCQWCEKDATEP